MKRYVLQSGPILRTCHLGGKTSAVGGGRSQFASTMTHQLTMLFFTVDNSICPGVIIVSVGAGCVLVKYFVNVDDLQVPHDA